MKKIFLSIALCAGLLTSCDMNKEPIGSLPEGDALQTYNDFYRFRNGIYSNLRALGGGSYIYATEIQMDDFIGLISNGNQLGQFNNGTIYSNNSDIESVWAGLYGAIANCNYLLEKLEPAISNESFTDADREEFKRFKAETKFARAYYYFYMFDHFCQAYTPEKANEPALGLPLVTEYKPEGIQSKYPGRSTMAETMNLILNVDLKEAFDGLTEYEEYLGSEVSEIRGRNSYWINTDVVKALQARIALLTGDYETAISKSKELINCGRYTLATTASFIKMWSSDQGSELIFVPYGDAQQSSGVPPTSTPYLAYENTKNAWYIPTAATLSLYDDNDVRGKNTTRDPGYFNTWDLEINGLFYEAKVFWKYPGNSSLVTGTNYRRNLSKYFRLAESYLIVAEASDALGLDGDANKYLNDLRKRRITRWQDQTYSGNELTAQIRLERHRELIGEGHRMSDLRRWKQGFSRVEATADYPFSSDNIIPCFVRAGRNVVYTENDHRYVWPIPSSEMEVNPQLKGQQNPGY